MGLRRTLWPYLVLLVEVVVFYRQVLFSHYLIPWDLQYYHQPIAWFASRSLAAGELPLWDPYTYCGMPIYANLTTQLFYPPTTLIYLLSDWIGEGRRLLYLLELQTVAHVLLGGVGAMWLLRRLGAGRAAALAGATVYQLGAYFASQTQHIGAIDVAAWLPLCWLGAIELSGGWRRRWAAALAAALAMTFLAGFPAATAVAFGSTALLAFTMAALRMARWRALAWVAIAMALALGLSAVQLLPTMELSRQSVASLRAEWMEAGGGVPLQALLTLLAPNRWGVFEWSGSTWRLPWNPTFLYLYCGVPALLLTALALTRVRSCAVALFAVMTAAGALWMLGDSTPAYRALFLVLPARIRSALYAEFAMCAFTLGLAVLAGLGAERLLRGRALWLQAALVAVVAIDLIAFSSGRPINTVDARREPGVGHDHYDRFPEIPARMRRLVNASTPPWRIDTMQGSLNWTSASNLFETPTANGNDPFALVRYMRVRTLFTGGERWGRYYEVRDPDSPILKLLNVRYIVSNGPLATPGKLEKRLDLPGNAVWENPEPLPRFFLVGRVRRATNVDEAVRILGGADFDVRREAVVEGADVDASGSGRVRVLAYDAREVELEIEAAAPSFLVSSETWYPGWSAWVDGREQPIVLTNGSFRGLAAPAGRHTVRMRFDPPILWRSALLSILTLAAVLWLAVRDNVPGEAAWTSSSN
jgi:hypothetical protein